MRNTSKFLSQSKNNHFQTQLQVLKDYWFSNTTSRFMASIATGIPIQNICRYVDMLKDSNSIAIVKKDKCKITGEWVEFLTTNPDLFPEDRQLKLFEA